MTMESAAQASFYVPQPRQLSQEPYEVCVYRTRTGRVVQWLPVVGLPRWESGLNITGSWQVQVSLDPSLLSKMELSQLIEPWQWSWAIVQGSHIHQAGPVVTEDFSDDGGNYTTVSGVGLWGLYMKKRVLAKGNRTFYARMDNTDADLAFGPGTVSEKGIPIPVSNRNLSLHTIMKRLFENEQLKPGGALPITLPGDIAGARERQYMANEFAYTGQRQYELTQVIEGPELELVPEFANVERSSVRHRVSIGNPRLGQLGYPHTWTYRRALARLGFIASGEEMHHAHWERGSGFERNVVYDYAGNLTGVTDGYQLIPLLEDVGQHNDEASSAVLAGYADAAVAQSVTVQRELSVEVTLEGDAGDHDLPPSPRFSAVSNGDTGILNVRDHPRLPDGRYFVRILRKSQGSSYKQGTFHVDLLGVQP